MFNRICATIVAWLLIADYELSEDADEQLDIPERIAIGYEVAWEWEEEDDAAE